MPRRGNELVVIFWRDIPAQVNARAGAEKHQVMLPRRFQRAIDDAAMVAGKKTANEYVGEWRRAALPIPPDGDGIEAAAAAEARRLEDAFPRERLQLFVANGGLDPDTADPTTSDTPS
jgi:Virulence factor